MTIRETTPKPIPRSFVIEMSEDEINLLKMVTGRFSLDKMRAHIQRDEYNPTSVRADAAYKLTSSIYNTLFELTGL